MSNKGSGPLVLLCHGWPESWYSWRHQIEALANAGYRVVAPDQRMGKAGSFNRRREGNSGRGPINWYRNMDRNWVATAFLSGAKLSQPTIFIAGEKDGVHRSRRVRSS